MIVVFGTVCLDRIHRIDELPEPGGYAEAVEERRMLGGEASNTAAALARWGAEVELYGNDLGLSPEADLVRTELLAHGLRLETLGARPGDLPICDVYVTPDGERTMFGRHFDKLSTGDPGLMPRGSWFTADANPPKVRQFVEAAKLRGMRGYLMDGRRLGIDLPQNWIVQCGTQAVGGKNDAAAKLSWVEAAARELGCLAVLTDGARELALAGPQLPARLYPSFPASSVSDSTGAGDAFRAGTLWGLNSGWPIGASLCFGAAAGALSVGYHGGVDGPERHAVEALIAGHPAVAQAYAGAVWV